MDISVSAVTDQQAAITQNTVQIQVLKRVLDVQAQQGAELARMVQQAAGLGQGMDVQG